jgi:hypothetical protein
MEPEIFLCRLARILIWCELGQPYLAVALQNIEQEGVICKILWNNGLAAVWEFLGW